MLLSDLVATSRAVSSTTSRNAKVEALARALRRLSPDEVETGVAYLSGELRQRQIGVGWRSLTDLPAPAAEPELTVAEVDAACATIGALSGPGSQAARRAALQELFARATADEQDFLRMLLGGELRQGALAGVMTAALAKATGIPRAAVDRAAMVRGDLRAAAAIALGEGEAGLARFRLEVGRGIQHMLASPAKDVEDAFAKLGEDADAAVELKLDGSRVQVHRDGRDVAVFTRTLDDVTARAPDVVAAALALPVDSVVLDGEAIAFRADGRPEPFQVSASRLASGAGGLSAVFFDVLHRDGEDLLDRPLRERAEAMPAGAPTADRVLASSSREGQVAFDAALARGHEGVMVKALDAPYAAGRRGTAWLKVKPRHTLDLVVLAAEWGHGRRRGWLSNLHLGARSPGGHTMLGKTFKGLTDQMLAWQTERLLALEVERRGIAVVVRPELVVEIAFDGLQRSPRYPGGVALRFARVLRHRPDKLAAQADTLETVLALER